MKKLLFVFAVAAMLMTSIAAQAQYIKSYDVTNAKESGFGGWNFTYNGKIIDAGNNNFNYTGGGGTLNDGIIPTEDGVDNQIFSIGDNSIITLHLNATYKLDEINIFGGNYFGNSIPGTLTGATVTIGDKSAAITSIESGDFCSAGFCNDKLQFIGTILSGLTTDTIILSDFQGGWSGYYNAAEITATESVSAVPEPESYAMFLSGIGLIGFMSKRRKTA
jgi:hypothetical protein